MMKERKMNLKDIAITLFIFMLSIQVSASNLGFLQYGIISDYNETDLQLMKAGYLKALDNPPGYVQNWKNEKTKHGGEITVIKQYKNKNNDCKRLQFKTQSSQKKALSYFNFCLIENEWKVIN